MFFDARKSVRLLVLVPIFLVAGCSNEGAEPTSAAPTITEQEESFVQAAALDIIDEGEEPVAAVEPPIDEAAEISEIQVEVAEVEEREPVAEYTLTYSANENGSISGVDSQTVKEGRGGSAVTAVPSAGYNFAGWSDGSAANPRTDVDVTADVAVTAAFAINEYALSYAAGVNGSIEGDGRQNVKHGTDGNAVTAVPAEHHHFVRWSDGSTANPRTDRNVKANIAVTAVFAVDQYTFSYSAEENGLIEGDSRQKVNRGGEGRAVRAVPSAGYRFVSWSDGSTANPRRDGNARADLNVTAAFALKEYTLSYTSEGKGRIEGAERQNVYHGDDGSAVTAVPQRGHHFVSWSDGVTDAERIDAEVIGDLAVSAEFAVNTYTIGGWVSGLVEGTEVVLQNNGGDDLTVSGNGDFIFETALLDRSAYAAAVLIQPTSPNQTCTVEYGEGTIYDADVDDIAVDCVLNTYTVGGTVFGLPQGNELVLRNGAEELGVAAAGDFTFAHALDDGSSYEVVIARHRLRPNWSCKVEKGAGAMAGSDVTSVDIACFPELVLQPVAGRRKIDLSWNSDDFGGATFNLCWAREDISGIDLNDCMNVRGGRLDRNLGTPHALSGLMNDIPYWLRMEVETGGRRTVSKVVKSTPFGGLNDTGIDWCADDGTNRNVGGTRTEKAAGCDAVAATHPAQDADRGRDARARARTLTKTGSGSAGFDFVRVCMSGEAAGEGRCPPNPSLGSGANNWACTADNVTGLVWEVKTTDGLRSRSSTYTWYNPDGAVNGGDSGLQNGGSCTESGCDTAAFIEAVNAMGLCGAADWRLPTRKELLSIVDNSRFEPAVDTTFFPNTTAAHYWSSSPYADQESSAWNVYFQYGEVYPTGKNQGHHVRLVRGRTATFGLENP